MILASDTGNLTGHQCRERIHCGFGGFRVIFVIESSKELLAVFFSIDAADNGFG